MTSRLPYPAMTPQSYSPQQWSARRSFVETINQLCRSRGISAEWFSDLWVARLSRAGRVRYIVGYNFPVNDAASVALARDKVATYVVLRDQNLPAVPHAALPLNAAVGISHLAGAALTLSELPLVIKPLPGGRGRDVYKITTRHTLEDKLSILATRHTLAAVSPFENIQDEFRVIMLQNNTRLLFRKVRSHRQWRHNLSLGATPAPVNDPKLEHQLSDLAGRIMRALGLVYAAVDIIRTPTGFKLLEVNPGFGMDHISGHPAFLAAATACYEAALQLAFDPVTQP